MAATTVKAIQTTLTADTTNFEAGLNKSIGTMKQADKQITKLSQAFQGGAINITEYVAGIKRVERDMAAMDLGYRGTAGAVKRLDEITSELSTSEEKQANRLRELDQLFKLVNVPIEEQSRLMDRLKAQYAKPLVNPRDLQAATAGFNSMAGAVSRVDAIMRSLDGPQDVLAQNLRELDQLLKIGAIDMERHAIATSHMKAQAFGVGSITRNGADGLSKFATQASLLDRVSMLPGVGIYASRLQMLAAAGVGLGVAAAAVAGLGAAFRAAFRTIDEAGDKSVELGINPNEYMAISYAAGAAGESIDSIGVSLQKATVAAADAVNGNAQLQRVFHRLGITQQELQSSSPYEMLLQIADGLNNIQDPAQRAAIATDIFGKSGTKMLQVFAGGSGTLKTASEQLKEMGISVTARGSAAVEEWQKEWNKLKTAIVGVSLELWNDFGPALVDTLRVVADITAGFAKLVKTVSELAGGTHAAVETMASPTSTRIRPAQYVSQASVEAAKVNSAQQAVLDGMVKKDQEEQQATIDAYFSDLNSKLAALENQYAKPISAQEQFMQQMRDINELYDVNIITLEKRNSLLKSATSEQFKVQNEAIAKQNEMMRQAAITRSNDIVANMRDQLQAQMQSVSQGANIQGPAAIERGTSSAFSAFQANKKGAEIADKQLAIQRRMESHLAELKRRGIVLAEAKL